jgi:hypothetical protein
MLDTCRRMLISQYEAALSTLNACVKSCPNAAWDAPVANLKFCQVVFHTLFFADLYLETSQSTLRGQSFHRERPHFFRDYEELEDRAQTLLYDRATILEYLDHCRGKARSVVSDETEKTLCGPSGFEWRKFSRAELHVYNIRHIQHHAAQLILRLRLDFKQDIPWFGAGWRDG